MQEIIILRKLVKSALEIYPKSVWACVGSSVMTIRLNIIRISKGSAVDGRLGLNLAEGGDGLV